MSSETPKTSDQPPLFPEEKKPEPVREIDWDAIRKSGDKNQEELKKEREEKSKKKWWDD